MIFFFFKKTQLKIFQRGENQYEVTVPSQIEAQESHNQNLIL